MKVKSNKKNPRVSDKAISSSSCKVPDSSIFFNFQYITSDRNFNFEYLNTNGQTAKKAYKNILEKLCTLSQFSWQELATKSKELGGFEMIEYSNMKPSIANRMDGITITGDTKLHVFRFGGSDYRMIGYKANDCRAAFHILAFEFERSNPIYNHGS